MQPNFIEFCHVLVSKKVFPRSDQKSKNVSVFWGHRLLVCVCKYVAYEHRVHYLLRCIIPSVRTAQKLIEYVEWLRLTIPINLPIIPHRVPQSGNAKEERNPRASVRCMDWRRQLPRHVFDTKLLREEEAPESLKGPSLVRTYAGASFGREWKK